MRLIDYYELFQALDPDLTWEMMITWGFGHLTDETDEFTAAWMFSCIINSAALAFLIVKHFGMFE